MVTKVQEKKRLAEGQGSHSGESRGWLSALSLAGNALHQLTSYSVRVIKMNTLSVFLYQQAQSHPFPMNRLIQSLYQCYTSGTDIVPILADGKTEA